MSERVSSEDVTAFINLATLHLYPSRDLEKETLPVEVKIAFDLLDARERIKELEDELKSWQDRAYEIQDTINERTDRIKELEEEVEQLKRQLGEGWGDLPDKPAGGRR